MDTHVGPYTIRRVSSVGTWALILTTTGERLRTYTSLGRAILDAKRYERLTAGLDK